MSDGDNAILSPENLPTPTLTGQSIVAEARTFLRTPWHHGARLKGIGIDCSGLLVCTFENLGIKIDAPINYTDADEYPLMIKAISQYCDELPDNTPVEDLQDGDILVFRGRAMYNHCGFYAAVSEEKGRLIHAYHSTNIDQVVETPIDDSWIQRIANRFRFRFQRQSQPASEEIS